MSEVIRETVVAHDSPTDSAVSKVVTRQASQSQTTSNVVYFIFGLIDVLLAFRLILKITGASAASGFVRMIYGLTGIFVMPFEGIFHKAVAPGLESASVFEPSTAIAIVVYLVLAWGIVKLIRISTGEPEV